MCRPRTGTAYAVRGVVAVAAASIPRSIVIGTIEDFRLMKRSRLC